MFMVIAIIRGGIDAVYPLVRQLVGVLLLIDFTVFGIQLAMGKDNEVSAIVMKLLTTGAMVWIIINWEFLAVSLRNTLITFGARAGEAAGSHYVGSGMPPMGPINMDLFLDPAAILRMAANELIRPLLDALQGQADNLTGLSRLAERMEHGVLQGIVIGGVAVAFFLIAITVSIALIEFWVVILFSLVLVPFTLWKPLSFIGEKAFSAVVGQSVKVGIVALTTGIVLNVFRVFVSVPTGELFGWDNAANILMASFLCSFLVLQLPSLANTLLSGVPSLSASGLLTAAAGTIAGAKAGATIMGKGAKAAAPLAKAAAPGLAAAAGAAGSMGASALRGGAKLAEGAARGMSGEQGVRVGSLKEGADSGSKGGGGPSASSVIREAGKPGGESGTRSASAAPPKGGGPPKSASGMGQGQAGHAVRGKP